MSPDPLTPEQRAREFADTSKLDDVPLPPPTDPALNPPGTFRCEDWSRRLDPTARRWIRCTGADPWPWVQFSGPAFDPDRAGAGPDSVHDVVSQDSPWFGDDEVAGFPVVSGLTVAMAFRHARHERAQTMARVLVSGALALPPVLDGADAEGAAPFKDGPARDLTGPCGACGRPYSPAHDPDAGGPRVKHNFKTATGVQG